MAKLGVYYGLCPLIDQKSLLGVTKDEENGFVIVTLGKNMAIKYKLLDQKQIHSWSSKDHLTSAIIYDKGLNQYVAVFNHIAIRTFGSDCENLDRIKKQRFSRPIQTLTATKCGKTLIIFKDGTISEIGRAIDNRKNPITSESILQPGEIIENVNSVTYENRIVVSYLVRNPKGLLKFIAVFLNSELEEDRENITEVILEKPGVTLSAHLMIVREDAFELLTIWSDGKLFSLPLHKTTEFPGVLLSVIESLSCDQKICMLDLNSTYIVLYGADKAQEGASLIVYNTQYQVIQCKQPFKIYAAASQMFLADSNILLTVGSHLAVLPFDLATEQLAALVGSHRTSNAYNDPDVMVVNELDIANWGESNEEKIPSLPIPNSESLPEVILCDEVIPNLIEEKNTKRLIEILSYFTELPEKQTVDVLSYALSNDHKKLLDKVLNLPFNDVRLLPYLRKLDFEAALGLLRHLLLTELDDVKIINWCCCLLDAHYQKFLLSKDEEVLKILKLFQNLVDYQFLCLGEYKNIMLHLDMLQRGKSPKGGQKVSKFYSIEQISLY